jgi:uncharacterized membrane protein YeaQ/YmgE (transglycosylase-associated protein family)
MLYIIGFIITGLVVGMLARGFMVDEPHLSLGASTLWGVVGALLLGWLGSLIGLYSAGSFYGVVTAALGAVISIWIAYAVFRKNRSQKLARS